MRTKNEEEKTGPSRSAPEIPSTLPHSSHHALSFPVVLFDGSCGLCHAGVRTILKHEREPVLKFASLDSEYASGLRSRMEIPEGTMAVISGETILTKSDAALFVTGRLRAPRRWLVLFRALPRGLRDAGYTLIAKNRRRFANRPENNCPAPDAAARGRFLP